MPFAATCMDIEIIILSKSEKEKLDNRKCFFSVDNYFLTLMQMVIFVTNLWKKI